MLFGGGKERAKNTNLPFFLFYLIFEVGKFEEKNFNKTLSNV
jgi:hypothetical protein